ncbi:hypothetical protein WJX84_012205 [Apatococcus fuscideae]|uniref:Uncharacterized protein n=1 Tax=Apatococcus fuscideae TaxID=2026836 RepID=A0AAW1RUG9_9CHLO
MLQQLDARESHPDIEVAGNQDPAEVAEASQRIEALQQRLEAATKTRKEAICRLEGLALAMAPWHATLS